MAAYTATAGGAAAADEMSGSLEPASSGGEPLIKLATKEPAISGGTTSLLVVAGGVPPAVTAEDEGPLLPGIASGVWAIVSG